jgi:hypothetical protein
LARSWSALFAGECVVREVGGDRVGLVVVIGVVAGLVEAARGNLEVRTREK